MDKEIQDFLDKYVNGHCASDAHRRLAEVDLKLIVNHAEYQGMKEIAAGLLK